MKTKRVVNENGDFRCFEFPNSLIGKEGVIDVLTELSGLEITFMDKAWLVDVFCEFTYKGQSFTVSEPYGDNSYYEITCSEPNTEALDVIYKQFESATLPTKKQWKRLSKRLFILSLIVMAILFFVI